MVNQKNETTTQSEFSIGTSNNMVSESKPFVERIGVWITLLGSIVTIGLTAWNTQTKMEMDKIELSIRDRSAYIEESKANVERYKWIETLLPSLKDSDPDKRNYTIALIRMTLTEKEAEQFFVTLQSSQNQKIQEIGKQGIESINNQELNRLVYQINANNTSERKAAIAKLENEYKLSNTAIILVLQLYEQDKIQNLSPQGIVNGLEFLNATDMQAWNQDAVIKAQNVLNSLLNRKVGPQAQEKINKFKAFIEEIKKNYPDKPDK